MKKYKSSSTIRKALLELAIEQKNIDSVLGDMQFFATEAKLSDFELLIASPIVKADKKIEIFEIDI